MYYIRVIREWLCRKLVRFEHIQHGDQHPVRLTSRLGTDMTSPVPTNEASGIPWTTLSGDTYPDSVLVRHYHSKLVVKSGEGTMVLQSPSPKVASDLLSLNRSMSSKVIGLITGHGHLKKHLHRVGILQEDPLCGPRCNEQEETAEHLLFDCPAIARERYAIFGSLNRDGEFSQEDLIGCFRRFVELLKL
ncbi:hypothetical protein J6590_008069 [Homalodisca vitripennis]|nr:hypothetical protein J6590_008069 [Homalodisca vitripennis]